MRVLVVCSLLALGLALPTEPKVKLPFAGKQFENHRLIDVTVENEEQMNYINNLADLGSMDLDIWLYPTLIKKGRVRVPPESLDLFFDLMRRARIGVEVKHNNLRQLNEESFAQPREALPRSDFSGGLVSHNQYYTFAEIDGLLTNLATISGIAKTYMPHQTYEERETPVIEITGDGGSNKKTIFIEAGIHAREWISPASMLYFIDRLGARSDADANFLYDNFNWYIVPVSNPDGYSYTWTNDRYWRKNRSFQCSGFAYGVDLNRNFDSHWGTAGSSSSCTSDTYRGQSVFSERESQNLRDKLAEVKGIYGHVDAYLSVHSFSQMLLTPYGWAQNTVPSNSAQIDQITADAEAAMEALYGTSFRRGSPAHILYSASGTSADWAKLQEDVTYSMTYELRPDANSGIGGFVLPPEQIMDASHEVWASIVAIANGLHNAK